MTFGNQVGVPLAKKLLKQCYDAGVNLWASPAPGAGYCCCPALLSLFCWSHGLPAAQL